MDKEFAIIDNNGIIYSGTQEEMESIFYSEGLPDFEFHGDLILIQIIERRR
jgi:hypothetical protein